MEAFLAGPDLGLGCTPLGLQPCHGWCTSEHARRSGLKGRGGGGTRVAGSVPRGCDRRQYTHRGTLSNGPTVIQKYHPTRQGLGTTVGTVYFTTYPAMVFSREEAEGLSAVGGHAVHHLSIRHPPRQRHTKYCRGGSCWSLHFLYTTTTSCCC